MIGSNAAGVVLDETRLAPLKKRAPWRFFAALGFDAAILASAVLIGRATLSMGVAAWPIWLSAWPVLWIVIAARQHAFLILMHDTAHVLAVRNNRVNDFVGQLLCSAPLFVSMFAYRRNHLAHHRYTNEERDPDWRLKFENAEERRYWTFPQGDLSLLFWLRLWRRAFVFQIHQLTGNAKGSREAIGESADAKRLDLTKSGLYAGLFAALIWFGEWPAFLMFWMVPAFFFLPLFLRIRSIAEHFAVSYKTPLTSTRTAVVTSPIEKFFFAPHNVGYHLDHHLYPAVPFYNLPALHALLLENETYRAGAHLNDGYFWGERTLIGDMRAIAASRPMWPNNASSAGTAPAEAAI